MTQSFFKVPKEKCDPQTERDWCHARCGHVCERCGMRRSVHAHHVLLRKHGGSDLAANLKALCDECHREVHAAPGDAYREGFLRRRFPKPGDFHYEESTE